MGRSGSWRRELIEMPKVRMGQKRHDLCVLCLDRHIAEISRVIYKPTKASAANMSAITTYQVTPSSARGEILYGGIRNRLFRTQGEVIDEVNRIPYLYRRPKGDYGIAINGLPIGRLEPVGERSRRTPWLFRVEPGPYQVDFEWIDCLSFATIEAFLKILMVEYSKFQARGRILDAHLSKGSIARYADLTT